jgi:type IV pilus assembly protein PilW
MQKLVQLLLTPPASNGVAMNRNRQLGLSLVELMIAMVLGLILMGGVIHIFLSSRTVFSTQQAISRVQESGRLGMEFIAKDARMAGYMGCLNRTTLPTIDIATPDAFWDKYQESVRGYSSNALPAGINLDPAPLANTDVIVVRSASGAMHYLSEPNAPSTLKVLSGSENEVSVQVGRAVVVSNCVGARIFKPSAVASGTITHAGVWGGGSGYSASTNFDTGAEVIPIFTTMYYIANNPFGRPALYQKSGSADAAVEVVEGVENMALSFGRDSNGDGVIETYSGIGSISEAQWASVGSVKVELLVQGNEANVLEDAQPYFFRGADVPGPDDRRLRQVFSSFVTIRGRVD